MTDAARFVGLTKIHYQDQDGRKVREDSRRTDLNATPPHSASGNAPNAKSYPDTPEKTVCRPPHRSRSRSRARCPPPRPRRPLIPATAVAIFAILKSKTGAFPLSTVILEQYRPPLGKHVIGMPSPSPSLVRTHTLVVLGQSFRPVRPLSPLSSDLSRTDSA